MGVKRVVKILMNRDGISAQDAIEEIKIFKEDAQEAIDNGDFDEVEELLMNDLGLEPDYLFDLIM